MDLKLPMALPAVLVLWASLSFPATAADVPADPVSWEPESVTISGGGWGRLAQLEDGTWLAVATNFPAGEPSKLRIYRSANFGRTWSRIAELVESGRKFDNGNLVVLPGGSVLLTGRSLIDGESYRLPVYRSADGGRNWARLGDIDSNEGAPGTLNGKGLWEPFLAVLADGRVTALYSNEKHDGYSQIISQKISPDGGTHWGAEIRAAEEPGGGGLRPGMPVLALMTDGRWLLVYEVVGIGNADVHAKISGDGRTWEAGLGRRVPGQHCGPFVVSAGVGRLFLSSCENQISMSDDFGESWTRADPPPWDLGFAFSWPALYEIRDGELGAVVTSGGVKIRFGSLRPRGTWPDAFHDDFDDGDDEGWTRYGGGFGLSGGRYLLDDADSYGKALTGSVFWTDGALEAEVLLAAPEGNAGVVFRARNPDTAGPDAMEGYYAGLDAGGFLILGAMDGSWHELDRASVSVGQNIWHRLRVDARGSRIRVYVDDMTRPKIDRIDGTHERGQIGVRAFRSNARFDDVSFLAGVPFRRGDPNGDGGADLSDGIFILNFLFGGTSVSICQESADTNDDGRLDISDATFLLNYLFLGGKAPNEPLQRCGEDPTPDSLTCGSFKCP